MITGDNILGYLNQSNASVFAPLRCILTDLYFAMHLHYIMLMFHCSVCTIKTNIFHYLKSLFRGNNVNHR